VWVHGNPIESNKILLQGRRGLSWVALLHLITAFFYLTQSKVDQIAETGCVAKWRFLVFSDISNVPNSWNWLSMASFALSSTTSKSDTEESRYCIGTELAPSTQGIFLLPKCKYLSARANTIFFCGLILSFLMTPQRNPLRQHRIPPAFSSSWTHRVRLWIRNVNE